MCGFLPTFVNGSFQYFRDDDQKLSAKYECSPGKFIRGTDTRYCLEDTRIWSDRSECGMPCLLKVSMD